MERIIYIVWAVLLSGGCQRSYKTSYFVEENRRNIARLQLGMRRKEVLSMMGDKRAAAIGSTDKTLEVWYYHTDIRVDPEVIRDERKELTPLVFDNGTLVGWGWEFLDFNIEQYRGRFLTDRHE